MKNLNLIKLVEQMLDNSRFNLEEEYNKVREVLKANYTDIIVFNTIRFVKGEFTHSQEETFLELHKGI